MEVQFHTVKNRIQAYFPYFFPKFNIEFMLEHMEIGLYDNALSLFLIVVMLTDL